MNKIIQNSKISFVRVAAMIMIIICHALNENNKLSFLGQVFNVGVFTFLFISGYLYGKKEIKGVCNWLKKRALRILVPMYVFMIFLFIIRDVLLNNGFEIKNYLIYAFNMQGLLGGVQGSTHLWFLTAIMFCYLITPLLNKYKHKINELSNMQLIFGISGLIIMQFLLSYSTSIVIGRYFFYLILYIFAYYYSYLKNEEISKKQLLYLSLAMVIGLALRFISKKFIDGSIFYSNVIVLYSQAILGIWIFFALSNISYLFLSVSKVISYLDSISFEVYIVHYMFFVGPLRVMELTKFFIINVIIAIILSAVLAIILNLICKQIYKIKK